LGLTSATSSEGRGRESASEEGRMKVEGRRCGVDDVMELQLLSREAT
jgi:hypothetical protein